MKCHTTTRHLVEHEARRQAIIERLFYVAQVNEILRREAKVTLLMLSEQWRPSDD